MLKTNRLFFALALLLVSCQPDIKLQYAQGSGVEKEQGLPDVPEGNTAGFTVSAEGTLRSTIGAGDAAFLPEDLFYLRSEYFSPTVAEDGTVRLDVTEASSGDYLFFCLPRGSRHWYRSEEELPLRGLVIPYSQFYRSTVDSLALFPFYARKEGGSGSVEFKEILAAVGITLSGNADIASVHLQNKAGAGNLSDCMAGVLAFDPQGGFVLEEGVDFVNLNCTDGGRGVSLTPEGKTFYMVLAPGSYPAGLTITVTGMDHKGQTFEVPAFDIAAGEVKSFPAFSYSPDADLLFFEHFDNFVWGGNVKGNAAVSSYAPDALSSPQADRTGLEEAFTTVGVSTPGSAFIQTNWKAIKDATVGKRPNVSDDYIKSRNIGDYKYLLRCQEYQGCVSVGAGDQNRGALEPFATFPVDEVFFGAELSFDICLRYGTEDMFCTQLSGSGIASKLVVDGNEVKLLDTIDGNNIYKHSFLNICAIRRSDIPAPTSERYQDGWHHVEMTFANLNDLSELGLWGYDSENSIKHGAFLDNIEIRRIPTEHPSQKLRVLLYNIQNGMWADQTNEFDNYVAFVKKYDPDVCVICEAQSLWKDGIANNAAASTFRLFRNREGQDEHISSRTDTFENAQWKALAGRYGHPYHAVSAYKDDYPQVITSKYPIRTVLRLGSGVNHGSGHYQVTVGGKTVNFVSLHLWPQKYAPQYWNDPHGQIESAKNFEGYEHAAKEVQRILAATIATSGHGENWLIMGDTNSISPLDEDYYYTESYSRYNTDGEKWVLPHKVFLEESGTKYGMQLYDMLRQGEGSYYTGSGRFMTSTGGFARMDIMYGSESMRKRVSGMSLILNDDWCGIKNSAVYDSEVDSKLPKIPSDHRPLLIEFDMSK